MTPRDRLKELFRRRALQFGDFTLASGKKSTYYVNSKKVLFHAEAISLLGELLYEATKDLDFQALGGLEVGAIPMAAAALTSFHRNGRSLEGFFVRKQVKDHGAKERLEGQVNAGDKVVVIDDVLTTGSTLFAATECLLKAGARQVDAAVFALVPMPGQGHI